MYGISYNAKEDGSEWSKSLGLRLLSVCVCVGVCVRACVCACMCVYVRACVNVYGSQIAQVLDLLWNNYKIIYFHNRITYISSPGRPSQSSNFNLVRRFRNERAKIITNWKKKKQKEKVNDFFLEWILSHGLHKQHRMRRTINSPLPIVPPIAGKLRRHTNAYCTQASDLFLQVLSLWFFNRHI